MATRRKQPRRAKNPAKRKRSPHQIRRPGADATPAGFVRVEVRGMQQLSGSSLLRLLRRACQHAADLRDHIDVIGERQLQCAAELDGNVRLEGDEGVPGVGFETQFQGTAIGHHKPIVNDHVNRGPRLEPPRWRWIGHAVVVSD